ncbi:hypothetical protein [Hamadaea tsunoensis]|uniref:hypothetical protein n=1 Tax=Hamadaea tsunoensis TaxID=53368 RepID=UPI00040FEDB2|nr:hypothetical protein [Hamadaea tsunoensis]
MRTSTKRTVALAAGVLAVAAGTGYAIHRRRRHGRTEILDDTEFSAEIDVEVDVDKIGDTAGLPTEGRLPEEVRGDFDKIRAS